MTVKIKNNFFVYKMYKHAHNKLWKTHKSSKIHIWEEEYNCLFFAWLNSFKNKVIYTYWYT